MMTHNSTGKFEAHITLDKAHSNRVRDGLKGWSYSAIDDDPLMGQKPYCYLTAYEPDAYILKARMDMVVDILNTEMGIEVLRTKVERIIFDSKTGVNELTSS